MPQISLLRLYLLRVVYLAIAVGMGLQMWPVILHHSLDKPLMSGVADCLLGALALLCLLGLRYPVKMLPLLLFEVTWKTAWLLGFALPLWQANRLDADTLQSVWACAMVVIVIPILPWRHLIDTYIRQPGDRWR